MNEFDPAAPRPIATAPKKTSRHWPMSTVTWSTIQEWMKSPADHKECGGYVLGTLRKTPKQHDAAVDRCHDYHRNKNAIVDRWAVTLDVDHAPKDFLEQLEFGLNTNFQHLALAHSTFSSTPDEPRYRMIIPMDRAVAPDEYMHIATRLMNQMGVGMFDPGSVEPERMMYKPSSRTKDSFEWAVCPGDVLVADDYLDDFDRDLSTREPTGREAKNKKDPLSLKGIPGAFNRVWEGRFDELVKAYDLPYEHAGSNRYHYAGASAAAGMKALDENPNLYFSFHANDPAGKQAHSAFDLVRIHLYGDLDEDAPNVKNPMLLPSSKALMAQLENDSDVQMEMLAAQVNDAVSDFAKDVMTSGWFGQLTRSPSSGDVMDTPMNWALIRDNDPVLTALRFNVLTNSIEITTDALPWRQVDDRTRVWDSIEYAAFGTYIWETYGFQWPDARLKNMVKDRVIRNQHDPVKEYLDGLVWDGEKRVETCLPGVRPTEYTRMVARKMMVSAVARIYEPGVKWDHMMILFGNEGLGKTHWINTISRGWTAQLGSLRSKDTLMTITRSWIVVSDEGAMLQKADQTDQKEFLTRTVDTYRPPYGDSIQDRPRRCVIWGTTNDEQMLQKQQGNRRFLVVHCEEKLDFEALTDDYVDQLWAEAVHLYHAGERLYLTDEEDAMAAAVRERHTQEIPELGEIEKYLDLSVPEDWNKMRAAERTMWADPDFNTGDQDGGHRIDVFCSKQIWVEALGRDPEKFVGRVQQEFVNNVLRHLPGWKYSPDTRVRFGTYGQQKAWIRVDDGLEDLI